MSTQLQDCVTAATPASTAMAAAAASEASASNHASSSKQPAFSDLLSRSTPAALSLFAQSSSPFGFASSDSSAYEASAKANLASKANSEWSHAHNLHPAVAAQAEQASGGQNGKGKAAANGPGSDTVEGDWLRQVDQRRNGINGHASAASVDGSSMALTRRTAEDGGALMKRPAVPTGTSEPGSSLSMALQLKRRQMDKTAQPETFHPRWKLSRVISGHLGWVRSIAVEPGNQWFATGGGDRLIKVSAFNRFAKYERHNGPANRLCSCSKFPFRRYGI